MSHWAQAVDGSFNDKTKWTPMRVPVVDKAHHDAAILDAVGAKFTVTAAQNHTVASIQTAANATLAIRGDGTVFTADAASGAGANAGTINVEDGAALALGAGVMDNTGRVLLNARSGNAALELTAGATTLSGGGAVTLSDNFGNAVFDPTAGTAATLVNARGVISGAGVIGDGGFPQGGVLTLVNRAGGTIDATGIFNPLIISTPGAVMINAGLLEATGPVGLDIAATTVDGSAGGVVFAATGTVVRLEFATIEGGTLKSDGTGVFIASGGSTLDGTASAVTTSATLQVIDGDSLDVAGAIDNAGVIALTGSAAGAVLDVGAAGVTLGGGGLISLYDSSQNAITADTSGVTLTNADDIIAGDGQLGEGVLRIVNQAGGTIEEAGFSGLVIDTGSAAVVNAGRILSLGVGGTLIESTLDNTRAGVVEAGGQGAMILDGKVINNGDLAVVSGSTMTVYGAVTGTGSANVILGRLDFQSSFEQAARFAGKRGTLELAQSRAYTGAISGFSTGGGTFLDLDDVAFVAAGEATFQENKAHTSGVLTVTDGTNTARITLIGDYRGAAFTAADDGQGGVVVHASAAGGARPPAGAGPASASAAHRLVAAMAELGARCAGAALPIFADTRPAARACLGLPRTAIA